MLGRFKKQMRDAVLLRRSDGVYINGIWVSDAPVETPIRIIVPQPVKENELNPLEEGEKVSDFRKTWAEEVLRTRADYEDADHIRYDGKEYKVTQQDDRNVLGNYYQVVMRFEHGQ